MSKQAAKTLVWIRYPLLYAQGSIVNQRIAGLTVETWTKAIPESRDRWQSAVLVWVGGLTLVLASVPVVMLSLHPPHAGIWVLRAGIVSLTFAVAVWVLRAATPLAALFGGAICLLATIDTERATRSPEIHSALVPLMTLFVLTFLATKAGKSTKARIGVSESRRGRNAAQVMANLGAAGLVSLAGFFFHDPSHRGPALMMLGALAEATADTVSSEIGAAFGGRPLMLTTLQTVEPGTDGALSLLGTVAGCVGGAIVVSMGVWSLGLTVGDGLAAFAGGLVGLFFDSLLGATAERRGWIGNDWVNFLSTVVGALVALGMAFV